MRWEQACWTVIILLVALFLFKFLVGFSEITTEKIPMNAVESVQELQDNYENCTRLLENRNWQLERYSDCARTILEIKEDCKNKLNFYYWILVIFGVGLIGFFIAWLIFYNKYQAYKIDWQVHQAQYICKLRKK